MLNIEKDCSSGLLLLQNFVMGKFFILSMVCMLISHRHVEAESRFWPCLKSTSSNGLCGMVNEYGKDHIQHGRGSDDGYGKDYVKHGRGSEDEYGKDIVLGEGDSGYGTDYVRHQEDDGYEKYIVQSGGDDRYEQDYVQRGRANEDYGDGGWSPYNVVNVDWYGAVGDGIADDTQV